MNTPLRIVLLTLLLITFAVVGLLVIIVVEIGGNKSAPTFILVLFSLTYLFIVFFTLNVFSTKPRIALFCIGSMLILLGTSVKPLHEYYIKNIPTISTDLNIHQYQPFTDSTMLARLDKPASFSVKEPLPMLDGATALYPLYAALAEATYPEHDYSPHSSPIKVMTTSVAYENLSKGEADLIFAAAPDDAQRAQAGPDLKLTPIGYEAFVFFVNRKNPVESLTVAQIQDIYSGKISNWQEVGGNNTAIRAYQRTEGSGSQSALVRFMGDRPLRKAPREDVVQFMSGIINRVANYRNYSNAIGYSFRYFSTEMVKNGEIKLLKINGIAPTRETIRSGEYPVTEMLYAVSAGSENPNLAPFIDWIVSPEGQELVEKTGYIGLRSR